VAAAGEGVGGVVGGEGVVRGGGGEVVLVVVRST
jgi:hypothetical protein